MSKLSDNKKKARIKRLYFLFLRDEGICQLCLKPVKLKDVSIDHKIEKNNGGCNELWNLQISHDFCNQIKGDIYKELKPEYFLTHRNYGYRKNP